MPPLWRKPWKMYEDNAQESGTAVGDLVGELRYHTDRSEPRDPDLLVSLAIVGTEATEALARQLYAEWTVYTPEQTAVIASALCAQIDAAANGLERLRDVLTAIEARGETEDTGSARDLLKAAADSVRGPKGYQDQLIRALNTLPYLGALPANAHETITAVAGLFGDAVTLNDKNHVQDPVELADRFEMGLGCGCQINLLDTSGEAWSIYRGDSSWSLFRESDGRLTDDGGMVFSNWIELDTGDATAHPAHLAAQIRRHISF